MKARAQQASQTQECAGCAALHPAESTLCEGLVAVGLTPDMLCELALSHIVTLTAHGRHVFLKGCG